MQTEIPPITTTSNLSLFNEWEARNLAQQPPREGVAFRKRQRTSEDMGSDVVPQSSQKRACVDEGQTPQTSGTPLSSGSPTPSASNDKCKVSDRVREEGIIAFHALCYAVHRDLVHSTLPNDAKRLMIRDTAALCFTRQTTEYIAFEQKKSDNAPDPVPAVPIQSMDHALERQAAFIAGKFGQIYGVQEKAYIHDTEITRTALIEGRHVRLLKSWTKAWMAKKPNASYLVGLENAANVATKTSEHNTGTSAAENNPAVRPSFVERPEQHTNLKTCNNQIGPAKIDNARHGNEPLPQAAAQYSHPHLARSRPTLRPSTPVPHTCVPNPPQGVSAQLNLSANTLAGNECSPAHVRTPTIYDVAPNVPVVGTLSTGRINRKGDQVLLQGRVGIFNKKPSSSSAQDVTKKLSVTKQHDKVTQHNEITKEGSTSNLHLGAGKSGTRGTAIEPCTRSSTSDKRDKKLDTSNKLVNTISKVFNDTMASASTPTTKQHRGQIGDYCPVDCPECAATASISNPTLRSEEVQQPATTWRPGNRTPWDWPAFASYQSPENQNPTNQAADYSFVWLPDSRLLETSQEKAKPAPTAENAPSKSSKEQK